MSQQEFVLRIMLLIIGFLMVIGAGVLKYLVPRIEVAVVVAMVFGFLCIITATQMEPTQ